LAAEVRYLRDWLKNTHPEETPAGQSATANSMSKHYRVLKSLK